MTTRATIHVGHGSAEKLLALPFCHTLKNIYIFKGFLCCSSNFLRSLKGLRNEMLSTLSGYVKENVLGNDLFRSFTKTYSDFNPDSEAWRLGGPLSHCRFFTRLSNTAGRSIIYCTPPWYADLPSPMIPSPEMMSLYLKCQHLRHMALHSQSCRRIRPSVVSRSSTEVFNTWLCLLFVSSVTG